MSERLTFDEFSSQLPDSWLGTHVGRLRKQGFGNLGAPLSEGEYVSVVRTCSIDKCEWTIEEEWRWGPNITRLRGLSDMEAAARQHLREDHGWDTP
ncbi:hypothetical protein SEA_WILLIAMBOONE_1 [Gordonia phage WilliamBoone]|nr:hypothetical protein SEA_WILLIAMBOONE_1 [Gordonia phage WilliamBoone]